MRGGSIAKRYATALLRVTKDSGDLNQVSDELDRINQEIQGHPNLKTALESPVVVPSKKQAILAKLQEKLGLSPEVFNLVKILIDQDRMITLPMLVLVFRDMADEELGQVRVKVKVAVDLGPEEVKLKGVLEKALGKKVLLETSLDPGLLGGLWVQVGDRVFDATLKRDLERIKENIAKQAVA